MIDLRNRVMAAGGPGRDRRAQRSEQREATQPGALIAVVTIAVLNVFDLGFHRLAAIAAGAEEANPLGSRG